MPIWQDRLQELLKKFEQELLMEVPVLGSEGLEKPWVSLENDEFFAAVDTGIIFTDRFEYDNLPQKIVTCNTSVAIKRIKDGYYKQTLFRGATGGSFPLFSLIKSSFSYIRPKRFIIQNDSVAGFVLSKMKKEYKTLEDSIREAQWKGIASENPNTNLHGVVTRDRFSLQLAEVFGEFIYPENIETSGINTLELDDVFIASKMNCSIRLLGIAEKSEVGLCVSVEPCIIPEKYFLAQAKGGSEIAYIQDENGKSHVYACPGSSEETSVMGLLADLNEPVVKHEDFKILGETVPYTGKFYLRISTDYLSSSISCLVKAFSDNNIEIKSLKYDNLESNSEMKQIIVITETTERLKINNLTESVDKNIKHALVKAVFRFIE